MKERKREKERGRERKRERERQEGEEVLSYKPNFQVQDEEGGIGKEKTKQT